MDAGQAIARQQALKQPKPADTVFSDAANNGGEDTTAPFQNAGEGETGSGLVASVGSPPPPPSLQEALQEETLQFLNVPPPPPPDDTDTLVSPPDRGAPVDSSSGEYEIAESKAGNRARGAPVACSPQSLTGMVPPLSPDEMRTLLESFNLPLFGDAEVWLVIPTLLSIAVHCLPRELSAIHPLFRFGMELAPVSSSERYFDIGFSRMVARALKGEDRPSYAR